jgi:hypothetical protein
MKAGNSQLPGYFKDSNCYLWLPKPILGWQRKEPKPGFQYIVGNSYFSGVLVHRLRDCDPIDGDF